MEKDRPDFSTMNGREKLQWFWYYYKWFVIIGLIVAVAITVTLVQALQKKDTAVFLVAVNAEAEDGLNEDAFLPYLTAQGLDPKKEEVSVHANISYYGGDASMDIYALPSIQTLMAAGETDVFLSDEDTFAELAALGAFLPVSDYLTEEEIAKIEDQLVWTALDPDSDPYVAASETVMEGRYLRGIRLPKDSPAFAAGLYPEHEAVAGLPVATSRPERAIALLKYLINLE